MIREFVSELRMLQYNTISNRVPNHSFRNLILRRVMGVRLGPGTAVLRGLRLYTVGGVSVGPFSVIDRDCVLDGRGKLTIGANVNLAPEVMVLTASHDPDDAEGFRSLLAPVVIHDYVWVATRAIILPGVTIGRGAVIAAGSVVTSDVEPLMIVAGSPARPVRRRRGDPAYRLSYRRMFH